MRYSSPMTVILASTSPRRIDLLKQAGVSVQVCPPNADETPHRGESPKALVKRLAQSKAESIAPQAFHEHGSALIIAADTIVVAPDGKKILGKPISTADAARMLKLLAGKTHTVHTGYCVLQVTENGDFKGVTRVVGSRVTIRALSKRAIDRYIETGEPMDKAGSYAAQGIGMVLIEKISGSYTNVVGLPMTQLLLDLENEFGFKHK